MQNIKHEKKKTQKRHFKQISISSQLITFQNFSEWTMADFLKYASEERYIDKMSKVIDNNVD